MLPQPLVRLVLFGGGAALLASAAVAQGNPRVDDANNLVNAFISDPSKRGSLCAYHAALQKIGQAQAGPASVIGRDPASREAQQQQQQIEALRKLGAAQGEARAAANNVDPGFYNGIETLRIGDMQRYFSATIKLRQLCATP